MTTDDDRELIRAVDATLRRIIAPPPQLVLWERDSFGLVEEEVPS